MATATQPLSPVSFTERWRRWLPFHTEPSSEVIALRQKNIYIFPTRQGFAFFMVLMVMLVGAINYNNNMAYMLTFLLSSIALVSIHHTHGMLHRLRISAGQSKPTFAGEFAQFQLWMDNRQFRERYALRWQGTKRNPNTITEQVIDAPAGEHLAIMINVASQKRGRLPLGQLQISSRFPLGLLRAWSYVHLDMETLVYPTPEGQRTLPKGNHSDDDSIDGFSDSGHGDDFIGYRDYKPGDSLRHVDWKAYARSSDDHLMLKQFGGAGSTRLWLDWRAVSHLNNTEHALSQLCLWILVAEQEQVQYGLNIPGTQIEPSQGDEHRDACLRALALFGEEQ